MTTTTTSASVRTGTVRPGRRVALVEAVLEADGQEILQARGWRIERPVQPVREIVDGEPAAPLPPEGDGKLPMIFMQEPDGYLASIGWRCRMAVTAHRLTTPAHESKEYISSRRRAATARSRTRGWHQWTVWSVSGYLAGLRSGVLGQPSGHDSSFSGSARAAAGTGTGLGIRLPGAGLGDGSSACAECCSGECRCGQRHGE